MDPALLLKHQAGTLIGYCMFHNKKSMTSDLLPWPPGGQAEGHTVRVADDVQERLLQGGFAHQFLLVLKVHVQLPALWRGEETGVRNQVT